MPAFTKRSPMPVPVEDLFAYYARPGALDRLLPPWQTVKIVERSGIANGDRVILKMRVAGVWCTWVAEHHSFVENQQFSDRAIKSPFTRWNHHHRFHSDFAHTSILEDTVDYEVPAAAFLLRSKIARDIDRMFRFRHTRTLRDLQRHGMFREVPRQTFAITGGTGLVGGTLAPFLTTAGHTVIRVARRASKDAITWDPTTGAIGNYRPVDTFIHLAGRSIAERWSKKVREEVMASRVPATEKLCRFFASLPPAERPKRLIAASAIGFYGNRGEEELTEASPPPPDGAGFLPDVCKAWEAATKPAEDAGIATVHLRISVALTPRGGALAKLILPTKLGLSGPIGSGNQWMPWIGLDDLVGLMHHLAMTPKPVTGPVNAAAPTPVRQRDFARTLAHVLHRPAVVPMPGFAVRTLFGQMGEEMLLGSARVVPQRVPVDFVYQSPGLESALRSEMGI